ncbi:hypothetical protein [Lactococcus lactis]|uniref:hypothetical protein n=1 Tax=Lactococcus lactis TaxID=1358 RepID=UPI00288C86D0|nr:hypothetical protein [Lactococcus lactis]MDT2902719.1 hypothetical protein [Lactococcus lactis]
MSELENIARDIVRHEEERQAEKIKLESEIKALEEVLEHGISTKFVEEEVIYVYSPKTAHEMREKLEENYKQLQPQLTIAKSIADELDKIYEFEDGYTFDGYLFDHICLEKIQNKELSNIALEYGLEVYAYLNPLTRDLVKVVEG